MPYRQIPLPKQAVFYDITVTPVVVPKGWQEPISQPRIVKRRQQPQSYGDLWAKNQSYVVPPLEGFIRPVNQPLRNRVLKRQQPDYNFPPPLRTFTPATTPFGWQEPINQPRIVKRRQQPQAYGDLWAKNQAYVVPPLAAFVQPVQQPQRHRFKKPQQPQRYGDFFAANAKYIFPGVEAWIQARSQPLNQRRVRRQQPKYYGTFRATFAIIIPKVSQWKRPTLQPLRYRRDARQQPVYINRGKYFPIPNPVIVSPDPIGLIITSTAQVDTMASPADVANIASVAMIDTIASNDTQIDISR